MDFPDRARDTAFTMPSAPQLTSERLARRWFSFAREGNFERLCEMLHEDAVLVSKVRPGEVADGREAVSAFIRDTVAGSLYETVVESYAPLDDDRVVVEGRMRWIDDERVIRDDPVVWALEFRNGLLLRFLPARTTIEAETLLATSRGARAQEDAAAAGADARPNRSSASGSTSRI
jgi:hypothetical protein